MSDTQSPEPKGALAKFLAASPDSVGKTIFVAVAVCLVASMVVSAAAVSLRPVQEANRLKDKQVNVLQVAGRVRARHRRNRGFCRVRTTCVGTVHRCVRR